MKKMFEVVYVDTYCDNDNYNYDTYKEWCEVNGVEPSSENSADYNNYINDHLNDDFNEFTDKLSKYLESNTLVAYGSAQRWNGTSHGGYVIRSVNDFFSMSKDCDYHRVWQDTKGFHLKMTHHDGTILIDMRLLTNKGCKYLSNCEDNYKSPSIRSLMHTPYSKTLRVVRGKEDTYLF